VDRKAEALGECKDAIGEWHDLRKTGRDGWQSARAWSAPCTSVRSHADREQKLDAASRHPQTPLRLHQAEDEANQHKRPPDLTASSFEPFLAISGLDA